MHEKILWRTPQIRSTILFFLISPWWLYLIYCFSFSQSIFSITAFKVVIINYWFLFLASIVISWSMYILWLPAIILAIIHSLATFYYSSLFLFTTTNKLYLIFNIIFLVASGLNILFWLRDCNLACYQKKHYNRGFFGKILKSIKATLVIPVINQGPESQGEISVELVDWDNDSVKMKLSNAPNDLNFLAEYDLILKIFYQDKEFILKAHATVWSQQEMILGVRVIKELDNNPYGTSFEAFYKLSRSLGHEPNLLY